MKLMSNVLKAASFNYWNCINTMKVMLDGMRRNKHIDIK